MRRLVLALAALLLLIPPAFAGAALDAIRARGVLRVGTTGDYKPFTFRNPDGSYTGADMVMAHRLADKLGVKLEIVPTTWATLLPDFIAGKYDIAMGGVSVLPARAAAGDFSTTVNTDGKRPIARCADKERYTSLAAINQPDVRVIVNPGASNEQFAKANFPRTQLTVYPDNVTVFDQIVKGKADVMVTDGIEVEQQSYLHPQLCGTDVKKTFTTADKAYLMPKDPDLVKLVDAWLAQQISSGDWPRTLEMALHQR